MSGGTIGAVLAAIDLMLSAIAMIAGAAAQAGDIEKLNYSGTIESVHNCRDNIDGLVGE